MWGHKLDSRSLASHRVSIHNSQIGRTVYVKIRLVIIKVKHNCTTRVRPRVHNTINLSTFTKIQQIWISKTTRWWITRRQKWQSSRIIFQSGIILKLGFHPRWQVVIRRNSPLSRRVNRKIREMWLKRVNPAPTASSATQSCLTWIKMEYKIRVLTWARTWYLWRKVVHQTSIAEVVARIVK